MFENQLVSVKNVQILPAKDKIKLSFEIVYNDETRLAVDIVAASAVKEEDNFLLTLRADSEHEFIMRGEIATVTGAGSNHIKRATKLDVLIADNEVARNQADALSKYVKDEEPSILLTIHSRNQTES